MARNTVNSKPLAVFLRAHKSEMRFLLLFMAIFLCIDSCYFLFGEAFLQTFIASVITAKPIASIINLITPAEQMIHKANVVFSKHVSFSVVGGCDGVESILIIVSALCAYKMRLKDKLIGMLLGVMFIYSLNIMRIIGLYYTARHNRPFFHIAHTYLGQTFIIVMACIFFMFWISKGTITNGQKNSI